MLSSLRRLTRLAFNLGHVRGYVNYPTKGTCAVFHVDHFLLTSTRIKASDANSLESGGQRKQCATPVGGYEPCARAALITRMHAIPGFAAWVLSRDAKQFGSEMSGSSSSHTHTLTPTHPHAYTLSITHGDERDAAWLSRTRELWCARLPRQRPKSTTSALRWVAKELLRDTVWNIRGGVVVQDAVWDATTNFSVFQLMLSC